MVFTPLNTEKQELYTSQRGFKHVDAAQGGQVPNKGEQNRRGTEFGLKM